jgi:hypothetical protein
MAQDPEGKEGSINPSHEMDMVMLYRSSSVDAEIEADIIRGILDSNDIPALVQRAMGYPSLGLQVNVHRANFEEARRLIEEAQAAGPEAALEAERA